MENRNIEKVEKAQEVSKYYINYIYNNPSGANFYHQLVRRSDGAILYANPNLNNIYLYCFKTGISKDDVITL